MRIEWGISLVISLLVGCSEKPANVVAGGSLFVAPDAIDERTIVFKWDGPVDPPMARKFSNAFERWSARSDKIIIDLNSPGGAVDEGDRLVEEIKKMKKTHAVQTYVGSGNQCASMCVPIYLQGRLRIAAPNAEFMFHEPYSVDELTGKPTFQYDYEKRQSTQGLFYRYYAKGGVRREWLSALRSRMQYEDVWKSGQMLKDERSNVVMVVGDPPYMQGEAIERY